ncbi:hypothetical protein [Methylomonas albis]|nr:hypothetical protein [Methylomonas albis]
MINRFRDLGGNNAGLMIPLFCSPDVDYRRAELMRVLGYEFCWIYRVSLADTARGRH